MMTLYNNRTFVPTWKLQDITRKSDRLESDDT